MTFQRDFTSPMNGKFLSNATEAANELRTLLQNCLAEPTPVS